MNSNASHLHVVRLCAVSALALGTVTLVGWALGMPSLVQVRPQWTPMVVNTAIGFVLSGVGLFASVSRSRWLARVAAVLGILIALLALEELCVLVFDISPALSLPELHRPLQAGYPHPGRMAPNTALCFLLFGIALSALARAHSGRVVRWAQRASIGVLAIGLLGVIGYSLQLEYLYGWTGVVRMAVHTGIGMVVLGIGLWNLARVHEGTQPISGGKEVTDVYNTATLLLLLVAASAGIGGFAFMQGQVEKQAREALIQVAVDRIVLFDQIIQARSDRVKLASQNVELIARLQALTVAPDDSASLAALRAWAAPLHAIGFSSVAVDSGNHHWQLDGTPARPALTVALRGSRPGWLLWQDGYLLRRALPVRDGDGAVGMLITEQPLLSLSAVVSESTNRLGETGEMAVCGGSGLTMHCFPVNSQSKPFESARVMAGQPLPMDYALRNLSGSIMALDYRQNRVLAAYGPVGDTGIGLVVKRDIAQIYAPIRGEFQRIVVFLGALLMFGFWLMRRRLRPLLRALEDSRARALLDSARFEAAVESNLDAFFILECMRDPAGRISDMRYTLLNAGAEEVLARPREEVVGRGMCELFPILRTDGFLDDCVRVVEVGEPVVRERDSTVRQMHWYQTQMVKLGDGVGLIVRDITDARQANERIRHQAFHDPLTGVANRAGFEAALAAATAEAREQNHNVALGLFDLDHFKQINDTMGHAAGDQLLQEIAIRLRECVRPSDTVARLGGDEFVVVLPNTHYPDGAEITARRLLERIALPMQIDGRSITVTMSIGVSVFPRDGQDAKHLLKHADAAMYRAKGAGRNGYAIYDETRD